MNFSRLILLALLVAFLLSACVEKDEAGPSPMIDLLATQATSLPPSVTPTIPGLLTAAAPIRTLTGITPEITLAPIVIEQPTLASTDSPGNEVTNIKKIPAMIQVDSPGEGSRIASPLRMKVNVYPGDKGNVLAQLIGEDGRLMAEQLQALTVPDSGWVSMAAEFPFEITTAGEAALLVVSTRDAFGRRIVQSAVPVILLQLGRSEIELPGFLYEPFSLITPAHGSIIKKGVVHIEGYVHAFNKNPVIGELITQTGGIMSSGVAAIPANAVGRDYVPFSLDIAYKVGARTPVRLTLRQTDERLPGVDRSLKSYLIYLDP